jgi:hypothetical protein
MQKGETLACVVLATTGGKLETPPRTREREHIKEGYF